MIWIAVVVVYICLSILSYMFWNSLFPVLEDKELKWLGALWPLTMTLIGIALLVYYMMFYIRQYIKPQLKTIINILFRNKNEN